METNLWGYEIPSTEVKRGNSILTLGSINISGGERQKEDFYATDPRSLEKLLEYDTVINELKSWINIYNNLDTIVEEKVNSVLADKLKWNAKNS